MSAVFCQFNVSTSVRRDLFPRECGGVARYALNNEVLCKFHANFELGRVEWCSVCGKPTVEGYSVMRAFHRDECRYLSSGYDCYCLEMQESCSCLLDLIREDLKIEKEEAGV
jgi:hypothetical protein